jgi:hypothetical protein
MGATGCSYSPPTVIGQRASLDVLDRLAFGRVWLPACGILGRVASVAYSRCGCLDLRLVKAKGYRRIAEFSLDKPGSNLEAYTGWPC